MTEPVYEYVKGKGWIIPEYRQKEVTFKDGRRALIIDRPPRVGEYEASLGKGSFADETNPGFEGHCRWIARANWNSLHTGEYRLKPNYYHYTVVFL